MLADIKAYDAAKARLASGDNELIPLELTERRLAGESTVKIWRDTAASPRKPWRKSPKFPVHDCRHRSRTQKSGIATLKKLAVALKTDLDELA